MRPHPNCLLRTNLILTSITAEITDIRSRLTNLLWDFDDYIEDDTFEVSKFKELQELDREVAPKVYQILITMKLEAPNLYLSQLSPPSSPHPPSFSPVQPIPHHPFGLGFQRGSGSLSGSQGDARSVVEFPNVEDATAQFRTLMSDRHLSSAHGHVLDSGLAVQAQQDIPAEEPLPEPPRPPSMDPWDPQTAAYSDDGRTEAYSPVDRRPAVIRAESPIDPAISPMSPDNRRRAASSAQRSSGSLTGGSEHGVLDHDEYRNSSSSTYSNPMNTATPGSRQRAHTLSPTIPEEDAPPRKSSKSIYLPQLQVRPPVPSIPQIHRRISGDSPNSQVHDMDRQYLVRQQPQGLPPKAPLPRPPNRQNSSYSNDLSMSPRSSTPKSQPGLEVAPMMPEREFDTGLIPVAPEAEASSAQIQVSYSQRDCPIGPSSTFYLYKGFCEGAKEVLQGNIGVKKTKKPVSAFPRVRRY